MYQRKPGQCAMIGLCALFEVLQASNELWMHILYLHMQRDAAAQSGTARLVKFRKNRARLSNVTLQGDAGLTQALYPLDQAKVYVQGALSGTHGSVCSSLPPVFLCPALFLTAGAHI